MISFWSFTRFDKRKAEMLYKENLKVLKTEGMFFKCLFDR